MNLVELYKGQPFYTVNLNGIVRRLPIRQVDDEIWIASNHQLVLCDVDFTERIGGKLGARIREYKLDCLFTAESKSLPLVYEIARQLGHKEIAIARKNVKAYMDLYLVEEVKSITTRGSQKLVIDRENVERIKGRKIGIVDDVVSTGGTMSALKNLVFRAGGTIMCEAAVWLEGPWYKSGNLIYLDVLPIFVTESKLNELLKTS